jgi:hypothetical protein
VKRRKARRHAKKTVSKRETIWDGVVAAYRAHGVQPTATEETYLRGPNFKKSTTKLPYLNSAQIAAGASKAKCSEKAFLNVVARLRTVIDGKRARATKPRGRGKWPGATNPTAAARQTCIAMEALKGAKLSSDEQRQVERDAEARAQWLEQHQEDDDDSARADELTDLQQSILIDLWFEHEENIGWGRMFGLLKERADAAGAVPFYGIKQRQLFKWVAAQRARVDDHESRDVESGGRTEQGAAPMQLSAQPNGNAEANSRAPLPAEGNTSVRTNRPNHTYL